MLDATPTAHPDCDASPLGALASPARGPRRSDPRTDLLAAAVHMGLELSHQRDRETGAHVARMARTCRIVAQGLADRDLLAPPLVDAIALFAPLHDVGKLSIPDEVLFKRGALDQREIELMQSHVERGVEIVDRVVGALGLGDLWEFGVLRNIVRSHHEAFDGTGYPHGLEGSEIPIEARVVSVADVFDALSSHRPYKQPWSIDRTFAYLRRHAGTKFDPVCVEVLISSRPQLESIGDRYRSSTLDLRHREPSHRHGRDTDPSLETIDP